MAVGCVYHEPRGTRDIGPCASGHAEPLTERVMAAAPKEWLPLGEAAEI